MTEKSDMERIGLFKELGYITVNDPYMSQMSIKLADSKHKGRQILSETTKSKSAQNDGYFLKPFARVFNGEGFNTYQLIKRSWRLKSAENAISNKPFIPASGSKKQSGVGSNLGCMNSSIPYMSAEVRTKPILEREKRNILTNPAKKGSGYGYLDVCLNPYPEAMGPNNYERAKDIYYRKEIEKHKDKCLNRHEFIPSNGYGGFFDPNPYMDTAVYKDKKERKPTPFLHKIPFIPSYPNKEESHTKFPGYVGGTYKDIDLRHLRQDIRNNKGKLYVPIPGNKSCIYQSILTKNINFRVNNINAHKIKSVMNY